MEKKFKLNLLNNIFNTNIFIIVYTLLIILFLILNNDSLQFTDSDSNLTPADKNAEGESSSSVTKTSSNLDNKNSRVSTTRMTEFEYKMNKLMNKHMDDLLANMREEIKDKNSSGSDTAGKEALEDVYYAEVDFKQEINSLTNQLEKALNIKDISSDDSKGSTEHKRTAEEDLATTNKKKKEE